MLALFTLSLLGLLFVGVPATVIGVAVSKARTRRLQLAWRDQQLARQTALLASLRPPF